jgi:hypothetical protein
MNYYPRKAFHGAPERDERTYLESTIPGGERNVSLPIHLCLENIGYSGVRVYVKCGRGKYHVIRNHIT